MAAEVAADPSIIATLTLPPNMAGLLGDLATEVGPIALWGASPKAIGRSPVAYSLQPIRDGTRGACFEGILA